MTTWGPSDGDHGLQPIVKQNQRSRARRTLHGPRSPVEEDDMVGAWSDGTANWVDAGHAIDPRSTELERHADYHGSTMHDDPGARLRDALELHDLGVRMYRQRLRREQPQITDAELDEAVRAWLHDRPGAEHGDAVGPRSDRFG